MSTFPWQDYTRLRPLLGHLGGLDLTFISKPGFSNWDCISPSTQLLAERTILPSQGRLLFLGCGHAAAAVCLSGRHPKLVIWLHDLNQIAIKAAKATLLYHQLENIHWLDQIDLPEKLYATFETVLLDLPKGRALSRRWLLQAFLALRPQGTLFIAGANREGIEPAIKDAAELFGESIVISYKKGSRLAQCIRADHLPTQPGFWQEPGIRPASWIELEVALNHHHLILASLPGIFSSGHLDVGTRMLLDYLPNPQGKRVADLGCGVGIIGLAAALGGASVVDLIDANLLAVAAATENIRRCKVTSARTMIGDVLEPAAERRYDLILSNPPFHAGREVDYRMAEAFIAQSRAALEPGGKLAIVANRFIRYDRLLEKTFPHSYEASGDPHYRVLIAEL